MYGSVRARDRAIMMIPLYLYSVRGSCRGSGYPSEYNRYNIMMAVCNPGMGPSWNISTSGLTYFTDVDLCPRSIRKVKPLDTGHDVMEVLYYFICSVKWNTIPSYHLGTCVHDTMPYHLVYRVSLSSWYHMVVSWHYILRFHLCVARATKQIEPKDTHEMVRLA